MVLGFYSLRQEISFLLKISAVLAILAMLCFFILTSSLLVFHTFLALNNLTTWEYLSWMNVTYMKVWPKRYGSPFTKGKKENMKLYCFFPWARSLYIYPWKMPKKMPALTKLK